MARTRVNMGKNRIRIEINDKNVLMLEQRIEEQYLYVKTVRKDRRRGVWKYLICLYFEKIWFIEDKKRLLKERITKE